MSGFGQKKREQKFSSKKLQRLSEKELRVQSINYHIKGNLDEAEKGYKAFLKNGFSDADIFSNYGLICENRGEINKAIKLYEKSTLIFPKHIFSRLNLSFLYYKLNNLTKAANLIEEAIQLNPKLPNGYCIKGLILKSLNKYNESKLSFEKAIQLDDEYHDAYINLGLLNKDFCNYDAAEQYYLKAIEINGNSAIAHLNLGACYKEKFELSKAILHSEIAIKLDKKLENAYLNLATIYYLKGDYNKSLELIKKEISIHTKSNLSYQLISDLLKKKVSTIFNEKDIKDLIIKLLSQKDISHSELFANVGNIISNEI